MLRGGGGNPFTAIGAGNNTVGYWLGTAGDGTSKLIVAPKSTESSSTWGAYALRGTNSASDGLTNTNTLASFGTAAHPAAGYCKYLSTGGYNTWYMPAFNELMTCYSNKSATPFATNGSLVGSYNYNWSSTEIDSNNAKCIWIGGASPGTLLARGKTNGASTRAVRRVL